MEQGIDGREPGGPVCEPWLLGSAIQAAEDALNLLRAAGECVWVSDLAATFRLRLDEAEAVVRGVRSRILQADAVVLRASYET